MSASQHPIAVRLERLVGGSTLLLATVMWLPLVDGIFPTLVLAGALDTTAGILQVGLLIFGGSATVAVLLAELDGTPKEAVRTVLIVGVPLMVVAGAQAALAPTFENALSPVFERFAAVVILAIAAKTASARIGEFLPRPAVIIGLGLVASVNPSGFALAFVTEPTDVVRGVAAAGVGVSFALVVAAGAPYLRNAVHIDRFRFGSAVALGFLPLTFFDLPVWEFAPLAVLGLTTLFALDPGGPESADAQTDATGSDDRGGDPVHGGGSRSSQTAAPAAGLPEQAQQHVTDGGSQGETDPGATSTGGAVDASTATVSTTADEEAGPESDDQRDGSTTDEPRYPQEREPWL